MASSATPVRLLTRARIHSWISCADCLMSSPLPAAQRAALVVLPAAVPADLAAGGLRDAAVLQKLHVLQLQVVPLGDRLADVAGQPVEVEVAAAAVDLLDDDKPGPAVAADLERRPAAGPQPRVDRLHRLLDVLRVVVAAADDNDVLDPPGDEQLAVLDEAEVARAQIRPLAAVGQRGAEGAFGLVGPSPVACGDRRPLHPDLADDAIRQAPPHFRLDDPHLLAQPGPAAADQGSPVRTADPTNDRRGRPGAAGDHQRRLGQPVAGVERLGAEAGRLEGGGELLHGPGADGLGANAGDAPVAQVEGSPLLGGGPLDAEIV